MMPSHLGFQPLYYANGGSGGPMPMPSGGGNDDFFKDEELEELNEAFEAMVSKQVLDNMDPKDRQEFLEYERGDHEHVDDDDADLDLQDLIDEVPITVD